MSFQQETVSCFLCRAKFTQNSFQINLGAQVCSKFVQFVAEYFKAQVDYEKPRAYTKNKETLNDEGESSKSESKNPTTSIIFEDNEIRHACPRCLYRVELFCKTYRSWKNREKMLQSTFDEIERIHIMAHVDVHSEGQLDSDTEYNIVGEFLTKAREKRKQASGRNWQDDLDASVKVENGESDNESSESESEEQCENVNNSTEGNPDFSSPMDTDDEALRKTSKVCMNLNLKLNSKYGENVQPETGTTILLRPNVVPSDSKGDIISMETQPHRQKQEFDQRQSESENKTEERTNPLQSLSQTQNQSLMTNSPVLNSTMDRPVDFDCPKENNKEKGKETKNDGADCKLIRPPLKMVLNLKHLKHQEQMRKPFRCRFCSKRFKTEERLVQHFYRRHHLKQQKIQLKQEMAELIRKYF